MGKVLVTGAAGFIGFHLTQQFLACDDGLLPEVLEGILERLKTLVVKDVKA